MSQLDLAKRSGISQAQLSKFENGLLVPAEDDLTSISVALNFPNTFFFQNDRVIGLPMSVQYRKRASVAQKSVERLEAQLNIRILHMRRLLNAVELEPELPLPRLCVEEYGSPEDIADLIRRTWLVPSGPIRDLIALVERAGCIVVHCDFDELKVDGFTVQIPDMSPCIFLNRNMPADRQRFSLAHELGHVVMHQIPSPEMEEEANEFASALLMPARDIRPHFSGRRLSVEHLAALKPIWRVSMAALLFRAKATAAITDSQSKSLWRLFAKRGFRRIEPPELDLKVETPTIMPEIVRLHLRDLGYDFSELAEALRSSEEDMRALHLPPSTVPHLRLVK